jgi:hypothetical protein
MIQKQLIQINNPMNQEFINLFHRLGLPLHFNYYGNKEFTNYQRIAIIILYVRSKKSLRDFSKELHESMWKKWLGLKKVPCKSAINLWMTLFKMKTIRLLNSLLLKQKKRLTAIDGTGLDSWQRSRHYAKRIGEPNMPYAKVDLFIDVNTKEILDFSLHNFRIHDSKVAKNIFKRNKLKGQIILADGGYDSEPLHEIVRSKGGKLYAPVRKNSGTKPRGRWRKKCVNLPKFMGKRSIVETVNFMLKQTQIPSLRSKKKLMKQREFGWHVVLHNIKRKILIVEVKENQKILFFIIIQII